MAQQHDPCSRFVWPMPFNPKLTPQHFYVPRFFTPFRLAELDLIFWPLERGWNRPEWTNRIDQKCWNLASTMEIAILKALTSVQPSDAQQSSIRMHDSSS